MKQRKIRRIAAALLLLLSLTGCTKREFPPPAAESTPVPAEPTAEPLPSTVEVTNSAGETRLLPRSEVLTPFSEQMDAKSVHAFASNAYYDGEDWILRRGVDVSAYQGDIDWQQVADSGVEFAFIRCAWRGYGAGGTMHEDECFRRNIEGARAAGLDVGVYFFSQATNLLEAAEEARFTIQLLEPCTVTLPVYFDWERQRADDSRTRDTDGDTVVDCCLEFCRVIEAAGYTAGTYFNLDEAYDEYDLDRFAGLKIWIADPNASWPRYYYAHDMWQYSFDGKVPGISHYVDLDVLYVPADPITPAPQENEQLQREG